MSYNILYIITIPYYVIITILYITHTIMLYYDYWFNCWHIMNSSLTYKYNINNKRINIHYIINIIS